MPSNGSSGCTPSQFPWSQMSHCGGDCYFWLCILSACLSVCVYIHVCVCVCVCVCEGDVIHTFVPTHGEGTTAAHCHGNTCLSIPVSVCTEDRETASGLTASHLSHTHTHTHTELLLYRSYINKHTHQGPDTTARTHSHNPSKTTQTHTPSPRQKSLSPTLVDSFVSQQLLPER